ncbi:nicotinate-nucleotide--dimethylbenzimidazole phosphoribosyltransferase [Streptomyces sp. NPDC058280]|uniref:nicotinate-nucleotide--dimethylbenzimidazole phosphoribosyltransferase n=1 Tax=Streptomyces sp. NPDC058280 TaxID=3346419 RepID=UPI0036EF2174
MTDTGQVPGEGLPENAGMVEQPGIPAHGAYTYLDPSAPATEDEDLLLMPSAQGGWNDPQVVPADYPVPEGYAVEGYAAPEGYVAPEGYAVAEGYVAPEGYAVPEGYPVPEQTQIQQQVPPIEQAEPGSPTQAQAQDAYRTQQDFPAEQQFQAQPEYQAQAQYQEQPEYQAQAQAQYQDQPEYQAQMGQAPVAVAEAPAQATAPTEPEEAVAQPAHEAAAQGSIGRGQNLHQPGAHEAGGRDSGSVDLRGVRFPSTVSNPTPPPVRRPLHLGPSVPDPTGGVVRSLADRGPAGTSAHAVRVRAKTQGPPTTGPEYLDVPREDPDVLPGPQLSEAPPQAGAPWVAEPPQSEAGPAPVEAEVAAETVVPEPVPVQEVAELPEPTPEAAQEPEPVPVQDSVQDPAAAAEFVPVAPEPVEPAPPAEPVLAEAPPEPEAEAAEEIAPEAEVQVPVIPEPVAAEPVAAEPVAAAQALVEEAPTPAVELPTADEPAAQVADPVVAPEPIAQAAEEPAPEPEPVPVPVFESEPVSAPEPVYEAAPEPAPAPELLAEPEPEPGLPEAPEVQPVPAVQTVQAVEEGSPAASGYDDADREAVLRVMRERRDIRNGFRSDPIPHEVLLRVLEAAHTAPSVGHSQPWDFVVIRSAETRRSMHELAQRQRDAYAKSLPKGRAKQFKELKIEAILDTPVNIVVTADPTRGGRHTLGRHTQPQMAPYSSALAVENLWLASRAEGLGVGWVSFFDEREMVRALGLPEHLEVVAYLCVGYVDEFPEEPELMQAGWSKRRPLSWVVHEETYGRRALPGEEPHDLLQETIAGIRPLDAKALGEAWDRQKRMTKPAGALGMLEIISAQLSGLSRLCPPPIPEPAAVAIFAGDHGVHAQGVTPWPQEVTGQMVANFLSGGAVCNAFATQVGAEVCVVDVGVAGELPASPGLLPRKVRAGTADFTTGPALSREEVLSAIEVGIETARDLVSAGNKALLTGEMGIANTTVSAALICVYTGQDPAEVTGRGTGINDEMHARKVDVVRRGLELHRPDPADPVGVLAAVGGLEHAALVGFLLGGASMRTPVILDGVSAGAAALVARAIAPEALAACIAGHRSAEPGHVAALNKLGLRPLVDLDLRLGEGTGALLALPVIQSAARAMHDVATFDSAGVTEK